MEWLKENYDQINPLGNLNILNLPPNSCSDILAILLSLSPKSFNLFWQSQTLQNICQNYLQEILSFKLIKQAQLSLLFQLQHSSNNPKIKTILQETLNKLKLLNQNQIIEEAHFKHLLQFLSKIPLDSQQIRTTPPTSSIQHFENFFEESLAILENQMHSIPMFADIGHGECGPDGWCLIVPDPRYAETVAQNGRFIWLLTDCTGNGSMWAEDCGQYAIVHGAAGQHFSWMAVSAQRGYEGEYAEPSECNYPSGMPAGADYAASEAARASNRDEEVADALLDIDTGADSVIDTLLEEYDK